MVDDSVCDDGLKQDYGDEESKNKNEKKNCYYGVPNHF